MCAVSRSDLVERRIRLGCRSSGRVLEGGLAAPLGPKDCEDIGLGAPPPGAVGASSCGATLTTLAGLPVLPARLRMLAARERLKRALVGVRVRLRLRLRVRLRLRLRLRLRGRLRVRVFG